MKESTQTLWFLGVAVATVLLAVLSQPSDATFAVDTLIGKTLSRAFDTEEAKSLKIVRFDEESATLREFEVAERDGVWSIPSKGGYPADAERQMAEATTGVMDLEILAVATQNAADHEEYGVVEPSADLEVGQTGVGTRVTLAKDDGTALVDIVVGKEVKDAEGQHYVRSTSQDAVFVVEINPENFSTKFEEWIEDDLLGISPFDIARVRLKDYSAELVQQGFRTAVAMDPRADLTLAYDDGESKWSAAELLSFDRDAGDYTPFELSDGQELNEEALNALKDSVDDLRIVDVERKPDGLSADLKAGDDFFKDQDSVLNLMRRGFAPTSSESGETEVLSTEGEAIVTQKNGVEYVLRFGNLQLSSEETGSDPAAEGDDAEAAQDDGVNRYLFLMARYNGDLIEPPELEIVPELPEASETAAAEEPAADGDADAEAEDSGEDAPEEESDADTEEPDDAAPSEAELDELRQQREAVLDRNQRARDEYDSKVAEAKKRVEELNARFGDWYYVIANDVYKKVSLGRDDVIKQSEATGEEAPSDGPASPPSPLGGLPGLPASLTGESAAAEAAPASE